MGRAVRSGPCLEHATASPRPSPGEFPRPDAVAFRHSYADRWSDFIRANFASPRHVAQVFGVDRRTARDWWAGRGASQGWAAAYAAAHYPEARRLLLGPRA